MPSTYTTNLRIEKMGYNEDSDTWGTLEGVCKDRLDGSLGGVIYGLTLSTAGSSATFGIAAGGASGMTLASAYTKTTSSWALGTAAGALDTGAIANSTWYHVWLIERVDVSPTVTDVLISLSATAPTMPGAGAYTRKRRIGSMLTDGSAHWTLFTQNGDEFLWAVTVTDLLNTTPPDTNGNLKALTVPLGVQTNALTLLRGDYAGAATNFVITSPSQTDSATGLTASVSSGQGEAYVPLSIRTDTSSRIRVRVSNVGCTYTFFTTGWIDRRGRDG